MARQSDTRMILFSSYCTSSIINFNICTPPNVYGHIFKSRLGATTRKSEKFSDSKPVAGCGKRQKIWFTVIDIKSIITV
jgi:hypothetical protein